MPQQSLQQVRVIDPILTNYANGFKHAERVGNLIFPFVRVNLSGGQVLEFGKESFKLYNARRAPGTATKRIDVGYLGKPYALFQDSLESKLPREHLRDASVMPGIDLGQQRVNVLMNNLTLQHEYECATLATTFANYGANNRLALSGTDQWSDPASNPLRAIDNAKEAIRAQTGMYPNAAIAGPRVHVGLKNNPSVKEQFKYTTADSVTEAMIAQWMGISRYAVGKAAYVNDANDFVDCWGNFFVLAYVPPETLNETVRFAPNGMISFETPSYGYTYIMEGHPFVEEPYYERNEKSWIYGATLERAAVQTGMNAGFLFSNVVA